VGEKSSCDWSKKEGKGAERDVIVKTSFDTKKKGFVNVAKRKKKIGKRDS